MSDATEGTAVPSVKAIIGQFAGDAEMTSAKILEEVRKVHPDANTTVKSVASRLCALRKTQGVEAVPMRGGSKSAGVGAFVREKLLDGNIYSNKDLATMANEALGVTTVTDKSVASIRSVAKRNGLAVSAARAPKAPADAGEALDAAAA